MYKIGRVVVQYNVVRVIFLPIIWIERFPVRNESRLAIVEESIKVESVVPITREILDLTIRQNSLKQT
jgi:hypothetical protein